MNFEGFVPPTKNYFPMPNEWIDICAGIDSLAELKVIQYVLRHTWGFQEYGITKTITVEEFMHGRKRNDGSRMDKGTGLKSDRSVKDGIKLALEHGYLICEIDNTDLARIKKSYALKMAKTEGYNLPPDRQVDTTPQDGQVVSTPQAGSIYPSEVQNLPLRGAKSTPRTEKDTIETHLEKNALEKQESIAPASLSEFAERKKATDPKLVAVTPEMLAEKVIPPKITLPSKQTPIPQSQVESTPDVAPPASVARGTAQAGAGAVQQHTLQAPTRRRRRPPIAMEKPQLTLQGEQVKTWYEQVRGKKLRMTDNNVKACNGLSEIEDVTFENLRDVIDYLDNHQLVKERGLVVDVQSLERDDYYFNFERSLTIVERNRKAKKNGKSTQRSDELPVFDEAAYQRMRSTPA